MSWDPWESATSPLFVTHTAAPPRRIRAPRKRLLVVGRDEFTDEVRDLCAIHFFIHEHSSLSTGEVTTLLKNDTEEGDLFVIYFARASVSETALQNLHDALHDAPSSSTILLLIESTPMRQLLRYSLGAENKEDASIAETEADVRVYWGPGAARRFRDAFEGADAPGYVETGKEDERNLRDFMRAPFK